MGCIDAASLAYERSVLATNPAAARPLVEFGHRIGRRSITMVRRRDSQRPTPPASEALGGAGEIGWAFQRVGEQLTLNWAIIYLTDNPLGAIV